MMRKRSIHMPATMVVEAITVPVMVRSFLMASSGKGMTRLQMTMVQKSGAKFCRMLVQKTFISETSLPYQVVRRSAKVK